MFGDRNSTAMPHESSQTCWRIFSSFQSFILLILLKFIRSTIYIGNLYPQFLQDLIRSCCRLSYTYTKQRARSFTYCTFTMWWNSTLCTFTMWWDSTHCTFTMWWDSTHCTFTMWWDITLCTCHESQRYAPLPCDGSQRYVPLPCDESQRYAPLPCDGT